MKKTIFLVCIAFAGLFTFTGCEKCSTCTYTFTVLAKDSIVTLPEACGNKKDIELYENNAKAESARNNGTLTCE